MRRLPLAILPLLLAFPGVGRTQSGDPCEGPLDRLVSAVNAGRRSEGVEWGALLPLATAARRCYGGRPAPLLFHRYETYLLTEARLYAEADDAFQAFFGGPSRSAPPNERAKMLIRYGFVQARLGRTAASLEAYVNAAGLAEQLTGGEAAQALAEVGERFRLLGDLPAAERYLTTAEERIRSLPADEREAAGSTLGYILLLRATAMLDGSTTEGPGRRQAADSARALLDEAARLLPRGPEPEHLFRRAHTHLELARASRYAGAPGPAERSLTEGFRYATPIRGPYPLLHAQLWRERGAVALARGDFRAARDAYLQGIAACDEVVDRICAYPIHTALGAAEEQRAGPAALAAAERHYRRAIELSEDARAALGTQEWSAIAFATLQEPHRALTRVLLRQGRPARAFEALDATRARHLRDLRALTAARDRLDADALAHLDSLAEVQRGLRTALADPTLRAGRRSAIEAHVIALQRAIERASRFEPVESTPLRLPALQTALRADGRALVSYFFEDTLAYAFVIRPDTFAAVRLRASEAHLRAILAAAGGPWAEGARMATVDLRALHRLYDLVFAPIRHLLPAGTPLVVVPEGVLAELPLGALVERPHPRFGYPDAPYLLRRHPITTELAATLLLERPATPPAPLDVLAFGRTRFNGMRTSHLRSERGAGDDAGEQFPDLPNVAEEVARVRRLLPGGRYALDEAASEGAFMRQLRGARVLHLASHAAADPALPLYSYIVLWDDPATGDDGTLRLHELLGRRLDAEMVVLSGCGTARGRAHMGEGMLGLQFAFRAAGARSVVATLWSEDDRAAVALVDRFYTHLRRGLPKDRALQAAQVDYLADHEGLRASPFFWAAPVLYGDDAPVGWPPASGRPLPWVLLGLTLIGTALALPRVRARWPARPAQRTAGDVGINTPVGA
jgi:CHAT domain-containing protein